MPIHHSKQFLKLQKKWYAKLSKSHFIDIEYYNPYFQGDQTAPFLLVSAPKSLKSHHITIQNHYNDARDFLTNGHFATRRDFHLWSLYCEGISYRKMIPKLRKLCNIKRSVFWICQNIKRLRYDMRLYIEEQIKLLESQPTNPCEVAKTIEESMLILEQESSQHDSNDLNAFEYCKTSQADKAYEAEIDLKTFMESNRGVL